MKLPIIGDYVFSIGMSLLTINMFGWMLLPLFLFSNKIEFVLFPWWVYIVSIIVIGEILFWLSESEPSEYETNFKFSVYEKAEALMLSILFVGTVNLIINLVNFAVPFFEEIVYILGILAIVIILALVIIYLNSLKFRNLNKKVKK